jgi:hypothetical protein
MFEYAKIGYLEELEELGCNELEDFVSKLSCIAILF